MKIKVLLFGLPAFILGIFLVVFSSETKYPETKRTLQSIDGCVFMTVMGEQSSEDFDVYKSNENVQLSVRDGLAWLRDAQLMNGGYGAGSHSAQHIKDPHAVKADPATTSMVATAFLRSGNTLKKGIYAKNLKAAINFLLA